VGDDEPPRVRPPRGYPYRGFFWPAALVLIGLVALLVNTGALPADRLYELFNLWPLILVVIGIELIIRRSARSSARDVAAALVVILAIGGAVAYVALAPNPTGSHSLDTSDTVGNLQQASLELNVGAAKINVTTGNPLGDDLYRAHIQYSGAKPSLSLDRSAGKLTISEQDTFGFLRSGNLAVDLQLNQGVVWSLTENSGATTDTLSLAGARFSSITVNTGASRDDITLGEPSVTVPITVNGGALTVNVHRPSGTPATVRISGGAVSLDADGRGSRGFGTLSYETPDFASATAGYAIEVNGGACTVTLDSPSG
jgi:hypothetical protein